MATGGSQCGFCTPGILMRLAALRRTGRRSPSPTERSTRPCWPTCAGAPGGRPIEEAARSGPRRRRRPGAPDRGRPGTSAAAAARAGHRGRRAPTGRARGGPRPSRLRRRHLPGRCPGGRARRRAAATSWPRRSPRPGPWPARSRAGAPAWPSATRWRSRRAPGRYARAPPGSSRPTSSPTPRGATRGEPASPVGNGGAFGGKRALAGGRGRPPPGRRARPPGPGPLVPGGRGPPGAQAAAGGRRDRPVGHGVLRVGVPRGRRRGRVGRRCAPTWPRSPPGWSSSRCPSAGPARLASTCGPRCGPRPPCWPRAARVARTASGPGAHRGRPRRGGGSRRRPGRGPVPRRRLDRPWWWTPASVLDEVVLRSYCIGATHQALGWVRSEGIAVDGDGRGARPDHPLVRDPAGPGHAPGRR